MKKLFLFLLVLLFLVGTLGACADEELEPSITEPSPPIETPNEPLEESADEPKTPEYPDETDDEAHSIINESVLEQFAGIWRNGEDSIVEIGANGRIISAETGNAVFPLMPCYEEDPESEFPAWEWTIHRTPNGAYVIRCCQSHLDIWFFPVDVEMVRYNTNGSLVPSDTSKDRVFVGTFSLTTCCPDEEIYQEVFYRAL